MLSVGKRKGNKFLSFSLASLKHKTLEKKKKKKEKVFSFALSTSPPAADSQLHMKKNSEKKL